MPAAEASKPRTKADFVLVTDPGLGLDPDHISLDDGRWMIGSGNGNRIVATAPGIEGQHCLILARAGQLLLKSWGERTLVNGSKVSEAFLQAGDVLTLGESTFQIRDASAMENDEGHESIATRIDALAGIVEDLDRELSGGQAGIDRLDATISRVQSGLTNTETVETGPDRLRKPVATPHESVVDPASAAITSEFQQVPGSDLRFEAAQQSLNQILEGFEEVKLPHGEAQNPLLPSIRSEQQIRMLDSNSTTPNSRAVVLQQGSELDHRRSPHSNHPEFAGDTLDTESELATSSPGLSDCHEDFDQGHSIPDYSALRGAVDGSESKLNEASPASDSVDSCGETFILSADFRKEPAAIEAADHRQEPSRDEMHSYVDEQRKKLRLMMEDFEPYQAAGGQDEEVTITESLLEEIRTTIADEEADRTEVEEPDQSVLREAVTATVINGASQFGNGEVKAARRSRDEAIRQLDELIRVASDQSTCDVSIPCASNPMSTGSEGCSTVSRFEAVPGGDTAENHSADRESDSEILEVDSAEEAPADNQTVEGESLERTAEESIEATLDLASDQLAAFARSDPEDVADQTIREIEFETAAAHPDIESHLSVQDAADTESVTNQDEFAAQDVNEFPSGLGWSTSSFGESFEGPVESTGFSEETWSEDDGFPEECAESRAVADNSESTEFAGEECAESETDFERAEASDDDSEGPEKRVQELRNQLAQMFDLPEDEPDSNSQEETESSWHSSLTEDQSEAERPDEEETAPAVESSGDAGDQEPEETVELDADDPNSIDAYMQQLLARNRKSSDSIPERDPRHTEIVESSPLTTATENAASAEDDGSSDKSWLTEGPRHRQDRDAVRASLATLREVANQSARSAVAQAGRTQLRREILTLTAACLICLVFAVAAAILRVNPLLPLGAVGVSLYFAVKLGIEIRRCSALRRQARQTDLAAEKKQSALTPDHVIGADKNVG